jgi:hypothetical protein
MTAAIATAQSTPASLPISANLPRMTHVGADKCVFLRPVEAVEERAGDLPSH